MPTTIEALTYIYDKSGSRIAQLRQNAAASNLPTAVAATNIAYDAANELTRWNSATTNLTYDNNGNLATETQGGVMTTYTWDARNRLTGISRTGLTASFTYDGLGRRQSKTINGTVTGSWYDGSDIYAELTGATPSATYIRGLSIDEPYIRNGASDEFYETDALGSSVTITNAAGANQTTYTYEPFGSASQTGTSSSNTFQYTGRENDATGLHFYRARYYSPTMQRFLSEDPVGFRGNDWNLYAYVGNRPTAYRDPFGLCYDPGGAAGIRYCVQAFIPYQYALMYQGDDRGSTCNDPKATYRSMQWLDGDGSSAMTPGRTVNLITGNSADGIIGPNGVQVKPFPLGGRKIRFYGQATNGLLPDAPPLKYDFTVKEDASGNATLSGSATNFPGFEVCQYGGVNGTVSRYFPPTGGPIAGPFTLFGAGRAITGPLR